ncbi:MAG TPA: dihydrolipoamide acetyltransferase family protein [Thermomicrobiales bacterium]|nr:dihydrolipoamide acetyltransferase family protein [Thermomicrobiales bacterium]
MAEVIMPKMGDAMEEGTLLKWLKNPGDEVAEGDPIAEIETDKVTLEIEANEGGFLTNRLVEEGDTVPIGTAVATIGSQDEVGKTPDGAGVPAQEAPKAETEGQEEGAGEAAHAAGTDDDAVVPGATNGTAPAAAATPPATEAQEAPAPPERADGSRLRASPLVKRLAGEHNIDLSQVAGSGPGGRIIKADIAPYVSGEKQAPQAGAPAAQPQAPAQQPAAAPLEAAPGTAVEMSRMKQRTGERMAQSKREVPHFYVTTSVDMSASMEFRKQINASLEEGGGKVSVNDLVIKAAALALAEHPDVNRSYVNGELVQHETIDVNMAVAVEGGLIAPFIPQADQKSLGAISRIAKDIGRRAREGGLKPEEYQGGTFTISNLGMFDVDEFIAVINPPQAAILAVASVRETPVVRDGEIAIGHKMSITLAADHRALDGAEVAVFLQALKRYLENPMLLALS